MSGEIYMGDDGRSVMLSMSSTEKKKLMMHVFVQWLAHNDYLNTWMDELLRQHHSNGGIKSAADRMLDHPYGAIDRSFSWSRTRDTTPMFWSDRHDEWREIFNQLEPLIHNEVPFL